MEKDKLQLYVKNVDTHLYELLSHVICSICQELLSKPVNTPCGHTFCASCIKRVLWSKDNSGCPLCKNPVKRYALKPDKVKSSLSDIFKELPAAFEKDVRDLSDKYKIKDIEDFLRTSKLSQLSSPGKDKKGESSKVCINNSKLNEKKEDLESFIPVLKRTKNVIEYASAKKKRKKKADDFVSVSQMEVASTNSSACSMSELDRKLKRIENVPPEEKVKEWFVSVGDNIYKAPTSPLGEIPKHGDRTEKEDEEKTSRIIKVDYMSGDGKEKEKKNEENGVQDPYEFIPSQNNGIRRKKRQKKAEKKQKTIPDFQALQNFSKESVKRGTLLLEDNQEKESEVNMEKTVNDMTETITASQKFDKLLLESKEEGEKEATKRYTLYTSQSSSTQFLDVSYHSRVEVTQPKRQSLAKCKRAHLSEEEDSQVELFKERRSSTDERDKGKGPKRRKSLDVQKCREEGKNNKKKLFSDIMDLKSQEAFSLEESVEDYLMKFKSRRSSPIKGEKKPEVESSDGDANTKLLELLKELSNDDDIYKDIDRNQPVKLGMISKKSFTEKISSDYLQVVKDRIDFTQTTALIGFGTQEEIPEEENFKQMVAEMEKELKSNEMDYLKLKENIEKKSSLTRVTISAIESSKNHQGKRDNVVNDNLSTVDSLANGKTTEKTVTGVNEVESVGKKSQTHLSPPQSVVPFTLLGKIKKSKTFFIDFLRLGRLTPTVRRAKSSVVKVVFPIGLASFGRRKAFQRRAAIGVQTSQISPHRNHTQSWRKPRRVSAGIQTPQRTSACIQTSQEVKPSVEIQTTQKHTSNSEIQTSQKLKHSVEVQTSQRCQPAAIQTTQRYSTCVEVQTSEVLRKPVGNQTPRKGRIELNANDEKDGESLSSVEMVSCEDSPKQRHFAHNKIVDGSSVGQDNRTPEKSVINELIMNFEMENELDKTWARNTQKTHDNFVENNNRMNKDETFLQKLEEVTEKQSNDSDIRPPTKSRHCRRLTSQDLESPAKKSAVELKNGEEEIELVDLDTQNKKEKHSDDSQDSEELMFRLLKNIDLDLMRAKEARNEKDSEGEDKPLKSEESDSDFVEQTPPRPTYSRMVEGVRSASRSSRVTLGLKEKEEEFPPKKVELNSEDLIADSIQKESESFLMLSPPKNVILTPSKSQKDGKGSSGELPLEKSTGKMKTELPEKQPDFRKPNENDQNQLNAEDKTKREEEVKSARLRAVLDAWKKSEDGNPKMESQRKLCVVATSVKNPDVIKRFVARFKVEFSNKPTKEMSHLIVGLHQNEEGEVLPLCTHKLLFAMANKKWVVSEMWAETCLKTNSLVPEDSFETPDPLGGDGCRSARLSKEPLFKNCEIFLLGNFQTISKEEFADLIIDCGGTLVPKPEKFSFSPSRIRMIVADRDCLKMDEKQLQELHERYHTVILSRDVIIMSIQCYKLANFSTYLMHLTNEEDLVGMGYPPALVRHEEDDSNWSTLK